MTPLTPHRTNRTPVTRPAVRLIVRLDARGVAGFRADQPVKVLALGRRGPVSAPVHFDERGVGVAVLLLPTGRRSVDLMVGPGDGTDEEVELLRTLTRRLVLPRRAGAQVSPPPIRVDSYWWSWWRNWSRVSPPVS